MLFNTWTFAAFLTVVFCLYHLPPGRWKQRSLQVGLLTLASYVFYAWQSPWLILLLLASTWINAAVTVRLINARYSPIERWHFMAFAVVMNLLILVFFKYSSLLVETFLPHSWWNHWGFDLTQIPLPVGISFFTFQGISLVIDVYRNPEVVLGENNQDLKVSSPKALDFRPGLSSSLLFFDIAFFKAFFPQLIAGPIVKAREFMCQIGTKSLGDIDWDTALRQLILGYFFKMVVADNIREATSGISYPAFMDMPGINLLTQLYAFSIQIYAYF
jgi:alginate O-acetyltransferase complex protein AlgI